MFAPVASIDRLRMAVVEHRAYTLSSSGRAAAAAAAATATATAAALVARA